jgi:hypothetical protein
MCRANRFLGAVVEIVSERRTHLAFEFQCRNEPFFVDDNDIPYLGWAK